MSASCGVAARETDPPRRAVSATSRLAGGRTTTSCCFKLRRTACLCATSPRVAGHLAGVIDDCLFSRAMVCSRAFEPGNVNCSVPERPPVVSNVIHRCVRLIRFSTPDIHCLKKDTGRSVIEGVSDQIMIYFPPPPLRLMSLHHLGKHEPQKMRVFT